MINADRTEHTAHETNCSKATIYDLLACFEKCAFFEVRTVCILLLPTFQMLKFTCQKCTPNKANKNKIKLSLHHWIVFKSNIFKCPTFDPQCRKMNAVSEATKTKTGYWNEGHHGTLICLFVCLLCASKLWFQHHINGSKKITLSYRCKLERLNDMFGVNETMNDQVVGNIEKRCDDTWKQSEKSRSFEIHGMSERAKASRESWFAAQKKRQVTRNKHHQQHTCTRSTGHRRKKNYHTSLTYNKEPYRGHFEHMISRRQPNKLLWLNARSVSVSGDMAVYCTRICHTLLCARIINSSNSTSSGSKHTSDRFAVWMCPLSTHLDWSF